MQRIGSRISESLTSCSLITTSITLSLYQLMNNVHFLFYCVYCISWMGGQDGIVLPLPSFSWLKASSVKMDGTWSLRYTISVETLK